MYNLTMQTQILIPVNAGILVFGTRKTGDAGVGGGGERGKMEI